MIKEGRHLTKKSTLDYMFRDDYESFINEIKEIAKYNEEIEKAKERKERLKTPICHKEDLNWKYQEYNLSFIDKTLKILTPIEVETFVILKRDALQLGFTNIIIET